VGREGVLLFAQIVSTCLRGGQSRGRGETAPCVVACGNGQEGKRAAIGGMGGGGGGSKKSRQFIPSPVSQKVCIPTYRSIFGPEGGVWRSYPPLICTVGVLGIWEMPEQKDNNPDRFI
jgi:hypothetical protein